MYVGVHYVCKKANHINNRHNSLLVGYQVILIFLFEPLLFFFLILYLCIIFFSAFLIF